MHISERKLAANRANAQKSTGPKTPEGKQTSARNRAWHGLTGRFEVLPGEDQDAFDNLFHELMEEEKPVGAAEVELVRKMAEYTWLRERAGRFQEACFYVEDRNADQIAANQATIAVSPQLERFLRYQSHHDRAYARASAELLRRRKERVLAERGFESQKRAQAREERLQEKHQCAVANAEAKLQRKLASAATAKSPVVQQNRDDETAQQHASGAPSLPPAAPIAA